jgi:hypothetical protein
MPDGMQGPMALSWTNLAEPAVVLTVIFLLCIPAAASVTFTASTPQTLAKGDTLAISGTGAQNGSVTVWVIGRNYFDTVTTVPDKDGNFNLAIPPEETARFSSGRYAVVIQDPGTNGNDEIGWRAKRAGNISLMNGHTVLAEIGPREGITANAEPVVRSLEEGTTLPGTDDVLAPYYVFIEEPSISFDNISAADGQFPEVTAGKRITISGTTNIGVENLLHADLRNLDTNTLIGTWTIPVTTGGQKNRWSFELDTSGLPQGEYFVTVGWMKSNVTGTGSTIVHVLPGTGLTLVRPFSGEFSLSALAGGIQTAGE